ncbi:polyketide synthase [Diaporthe amygdali]|uniref:polyketide synthase n=1 Tax=Phomopsis amygdali TaxID=1214568 RepID=UPI0022FEA14D|nr:polyketide synthase [Diaporthe amygdali]KAJ0120167.1 polyketide synthase [Diaporthe amygdali]
MKSSEQGTSADGCLLDKAAEAASTTYVPIAVCGMALRVPGGVRHPNELWDMLTSKGEGRNVIPSDRFSVEGYYSEHQPKQGTINFKHGYFLEDGLQHFDASFFSMSRREVERLDPQQRLLLEVVHECMESAGEVGWRGKNIGCMVGSFGQDWSELSQSDKLASGLYTITGQGDFLLANRVSFEYDLKGPSLTVKTACSSAAIAFHLACTALARGECEGVIVGGTSVFTAPGASVAMTEQGLVSPEGRSKPFDASADGYARAEAVNSVYLKRLDDALRDGTPVRAVVRGSALNSDGKSASLASPSAEAHELLIRKAYAAAGLEEADAPYVECHGTGTKVGDPLETAAISSVFGNRGTYLGSEPTPWPKDRPERASINSFGLGGANAHVILDSASSFTRPSNKSDGYSNGRTNGHRATVAIQNTSCDANLLVLSANRPESLEKMVQNIRKYAEDHSGSVSDLAKNRSDQMNFPSVKTASPSPVSFVFTGQGAQWPQMGKALFTEYLTFANRIDDLDIVLEKIQSQGSKWSMRERIFAPASESRIDEAEFSQPVCTAVQIGLVDLWREFGVVPDSVVGHSSGEIAAAYAAGAISAESAIKIAYYRGRLSKFARKDGAMLAVGLGPEAVTPFLVDGAVVACENSSASVTVSGDEAAVDEVAAAIRTHHPDILVRRLRVQQAYHSLRFDTAVRSLLQHMSEADDGHSRIMLEIGPHSALAGPLRQIFRDTNSKLLYASTLVRHRNGKESLLEAVGQLWVRSVQVNLSTLFPAGGKVLTDLPPYPWYHEQPFWEENRIAQQWRFRKELPHEILGSPILEWNDMEPTWRNILSVEDIPWLSDHKIGKDIVFPAAGYIAMVGEALRQIGGGPAYSLRHVVVGNAMVLSSRVEVMTVLRKAQLTTSQRSDWYDFSISSYSGSSWIRNCWGQVLAGRSTGIPKPELSCLSEDMPTTVDSRRWYQTMSKVGLNYTGPFRALEDIRSHPQSHAAYGTIHDHVEVGEPRYQLHPSTMDNVFQLLTVASAHGQPRLFKTLAVPTFIEHIYVNGQGKGMDVNARVTVEPTSAGGMLGNGIGYLKSAGSSVPAVTFEVSGLKASPVDVGGILDPDPHAAVQLEWQPLFDYVDAGKLMRTTKKFTDEITELEKLFVLSAVDTIEKLEAVHEAAHPHLCKFQSWLRDFVSQVRNNGSHIFGNAGALTQITAGERENKIQALYSSLLSTEMRNYAIAVNMNRLSAVEVFQGTAEPLDILMKDNNLHKIYDFLCFWDYNDFLQLLGHNKPTLRVLEIGAGTGGTTGTILSGLQSKYGERLYSRYTYTDISPGFFSAAQQRFRDNEGIEYKVLDISKNPIEQGFEAGSYDLILAANVLHATPNLGETLVNVRKLLNPHGGRLLLQELNPIAKCVNFIFGMLPGWWLGAEDGRLVEPYISPDRWDRELQAAGFKGADAAVYDHEAPFHINATIVASADPSWTGERLLTIGQLAAKPTVTFINSGGDIDPIQKLYAQEFEARQFRVQWRTFADTPSPDQSIVVTVDLKTPYLDSISERYFKELIAWVAALQPGQRVLWLTRCTQMGRGNDPRFATILGLARNIRSEMSVAFTTIEIDKPEDVLAREIVPRIFSDFHTPRGGTVATEPDHEFVISDGVPHIGRFHWISVNEELRKTQEGASTKINGAASDADNSTTRLHIGTPGLLQTLHYENMQLPPLKPDEILIKVRATGLNFKDLLIAMGIVDTPALGPDAAAIGIETAGIVQDVGSSVTNFRPGQRVMAVSIHCFASHVVTRQATCVAIPDELDFVKAATMPCVYATVIRALIDIGRMEKEQTVLIHSACGGVGIAAIQLCKMVGARVLATVGSVEKRKYLTETFGIPATDIFDSRGPSFFPDVMQATNGRGVDLCLNSLSGELLHYSWQCVAEFGMLLEIGKRDLVGRGKLSLLPFEDNRSYAGIDLSHIFVEKPHLWESLLTRIVDFFRNGHIKPISPVTVFAARDYQDMFRFMQKGSHIGKIVLEMTENPESLLDLTVHTASRIHFRPEASYLVTGGLGGLGKSTARWMVDKGAKNLIFLSRRGMTPSTVKFLAELEASGCSPVLITGSVEDDAVVRLAVKEAKFPIAGVIHGAMVLKDHATRNMPYSDWQTVIGPRVTGVWNLHHALESVQLDFFILLGSFSGMVGQPGQANYAASNTFLNSFVQYRHGLGLPASALEMGPISDVGYVAESPAILESMKAMSTYAISEQEYLDALQLAILRSPALPFDTDKAFTNPSVIGVGLRSTTPLDDLGNRLVWRRDIRLSIYRNLEEVGSSASAVSGSRNDAIKHLLSPEHVSDHMTISKLALEIGRTLCGFLMQQEEDIALDKPLSGLGVDSLVAIELRNWCRQHLSLEVSVLEIMQSNLETLARLAVENLCNKINANSGANGGGANGTLPEERDRYDQILEVKVP